MSERKRPGEILEASIAKLSDRDRATFLSYLKKQARADDDVKTLRALKDYQALQSERAASTARTNEVV